jgi:hypothetical protein
VIFDRDTLTWVLKGRLREAGTNSVFAASGE